MGAAAAGEELLVDPSTAERVLQAALRRGVLGITQRGKWHYRLQPALTIPPEVFRDTCARLRDAVAEVAANPPAARGSVLESVAEEAR